MHQHELGEVTHEWFCFYMQVAEHLIYATAADHLDDIAVNDRTYDSHGTCGTEQMIGDIFGFKCQVWAAKYTICLEGLVDHGWRYIFPSSF